MFDNRSDEEVFGASYDFVELYLNFLNYPIWLQDNLLKKLSNDTLNVFNNMKKNLEDLHEYNKHKYLIGSPAVHLDVIESSVKGGWIDGIHSGRYKYIDKKLILTNKFTGFSDNNLDLKINLEEKEINFSKKIKSLRTIKNFLSNENLCEINNFIINNEHNFLRTNEHGYKSLWRNDLGSERISFFSENFALNILNQLKFLNVMENIKLKDSFELTNFGNGKTFRLKKINPMFRVLRYNEGNLLLPHYDDSFIEDENNRSLITILIGIKEPLIGGETQFKILEQDNKRYFERDFSDHNTLFNEENESIKIKSGDLVLFDHRILHQSSPILKGCKIIIRTEVMFERCD